MNIGGAAGKSLERRKEIAVFQAQKQEQMRASLRWTTMLLGWGAILAPSMALAQSTSDPQTKAPPADAVGPTELQNFSLPGSSAKPADQPPAGPTQPAQSSAQTNAPSVETSSPPDRQRSEPHRVAEASQKRKPAPIASEAQAPARPAAISPQPSTVTPSPAAPPVAQTELPPTPVPQGPANATVPQQRVSFLPWLIGALVLVAGTLMLLWHRRARKEYAGDDAFDVVAAPAPAPALVSPAPVPLTRASVPQPEPEALPPLRRQGGGIVSSRLRPSLEITVQPLRCLVDGDRVVLEFELELFNAGTAPARAVQAEASLLNAGGTHEHELAAFFSRPASTGDQIDAIGPMKRMAFTSQVVAPRAALPDYEVGGRKAIVPVLAFNALYQWSGGKAQTSAAYLVGRETRTEKLGPFVSDGANREFRGLAAQLLPTSLRT